MVNTKKYDVIIIGASTAGLAHAYQAAQLGLHVLVIEKRQETDITTFLSQGILRPFGEMPGRDYHLALRSREIWIDLFEKLKLPYHTNGSYIIAHSKEEFDVMEEFHDKIKKTAYKASLLLPYQIIEKTKVVVSAGLWGGLYSPTEISFDVNNLFACWLPFLKQELKVDFLWQTQVTSVSRHTVTTTDAIHKADTIFVCCNSDMSLLFPQLIDTTIRHNKFQITKLQPTSSKWRLGALISGGLTLLQDNALQGLCKLDAYTNALKKEGSKLYDHQLHFIVSQSPTGHILIGLYQNDININHSLSDELLYTLVQKEINLIIQMPRTTIVEKSKCSYSTSTNCDNEAFSNPSPGVYIINDQGQAGLNLSMGHAYDNMNRLMVLQKSY